MAISLLSERYNQRRGLGSMGFRASLSHFGSLELLGLFGATWAPLFFIFLLFGSAYFQISFAAQP